MAEPLCMASWHAAVLGALKELKWIRDADTYPERVTQLVTPAVFLAVDGWDAKNNADGQMTVVLSAALWVLVDRAGEPDKEKKEERRAIKPDIFIRSAAAALSHWLDGQTFGLANVEPAIFISADADETDPRLDDYLVWQISFNQTVTFGVDPFATDNLPLQRVWLGVAPEIGRQHVDDYRLIFEGKQGE
ncbi:hypothetical protein DPU22_25875 [Salmonella enterica subsp. enterica serovar Newport]|uniref:Phage protein n=1 Tax=Salmonella enterica I TaxID=59201 RepID=A0A3V2P170_SALET|nr:hypothetical protein [Salmonella enterica subsp. enterica serovar Newport]ECI2684864.1 hypothetical protein [Salmonella enterica subsp. enterica]EEC4937276.1 hypothetical protein [Salmonella enterica subsp. enterica serovar Kasenyi]EGI6131398.1 hypothetical protein [Salmonella enterica subsp. enterica serovar Reading]HDC2224605.1 hypothetical protein [Salmonella enterica]